MLDFSVLSYNIHRGQNAQEKYNLGKIVKTIKDSGAQIAGLNEVDRNWSDRSKCEDQTQILPEKLQMASVFGASLDEPSINEGGLWRQYGNLLLCRYPILESKVEKMYIKDDPEIEYDGMRETEPRSIIEAKLNLSGQAVWVLCTHLAAHDSKERLRQIAKIEKMLSLCDGPLILIGDLNASPDSEELARLRKLLGDPSEGKGLVTKPDEKRQIDYILVRDFTVSEIKVLESDASDHLPLLARLSF